MAATPPLICEVTRGDMVESRHCVHVMILDASGVLGQWGDPDLMFYPRSAIKYFQALPLLESGAAAKLALGDPEIALACASHSGAADHVTKVAAWLERIGLDSECLGCGAHIPYDDEAAADLIRAGTKPTRLHNNCSGKHTGFLSTALHLGEPVAGYLEADHPVQRRLYDILVSFSGQDLAETGRGIDGCGIPVYGMTLRALATAAQKLSQPQGLGEERGRAARRILDAARAHPYLIAGRARFDTVAMTALAGAAVTKGGAEGVHLAIVPDKGIGIALKAEDGEKRASETAMAWALDRLGLIGPAAGEAMRPYLSPIIANAAGDPAGTIRIAEAR